MATSPLTVLLLGATGETGRCVLSSSLASSFISSLHSFGRRAPTTPTDPKLQHHTIDFEGLLASDQAEALKLQRVSADAVVIALGTTRARVNNDMEKYVRIDREYVLAAAKEAKVAGKDQRVVYCSSSGANSSSWFCTFLYSSPILQFTNGHAYVKQLIQRQKVSPKKAWHPSVTRRQ
jgi:oxidoreductase